MISSNLIFNFINFCVIDSFFTKLLTLGILFSAALRTVVVAKLVILGILFLKLDIFLTSFILALRVVLVAQLVISGVLYSMLLILTLYKSFLTT